MLRNKQITFYIKLNKQNLTLSKFNFAHSSRRRNFAIKSPLTLSLSQHPSKKIDKN